MRCWTSRRLETAGITRWRSSLRTTPCCTLGNNWMRRTERTRTTGKTRATGCEFAGTTPRITGTFPRVCITSIPVTMSSDRMKRFPLRRCWTPLKHASVANSQNEGEGKGTPHGIQVASTDGPTNGGTEWRSLPGVITPDRVCRGHRDVSTSSDRCCGECQAF